MARQTALQPVSQSITKKSGEIVEELKKYINFVAHGRRSPGRVRGGMRTYLSEAFIGADS